MHPIKSVKRFFRNRYVSVVEFFAARFMATAISMMYYLMSFKGKELVHVETLATRFAVLTAGLMRELIVLKGKNPDYVAPPPLPPAPPKDEPRINGRLNGPAHFVGSAGYVPAWAAASFKDLSKHPVIKSRIALEAAEALKDAPAVVFQPVEELTVLSAEEPVEVVLPTEEIVH